MYRLLSNISSLLLNLFVCKSADINIHFNENVSQNVDMGLSCILISKNGNIYIIFFMACSPTNLSGFLIFQQGFIKCCVELVKISYDCD